MVIFNMIINALLTIYVISVLVMSALYLFVYKRDKSKLKIKIDGNLLPIWTLIFTPFLNTFIATQIVRSVEIECELERRKPTMKDRLRTIAVRLLLLYLALEIGSRLIG